VGEEDKVGPRGTRVGARRRTMEERDPPGERKHFPSGYLNFSGRKTKGKDKEVTPPDSGDCAVGTDSAPTSGLCRFGTRVT
jgi:hypothetical protein